MNRICLFAAALGATFFFTGCSSSEPGGTAGANVLHIGNGPEPQDLDPHTVTGVPEHRLCSALFEGLVNLDPATLEPIPGVAQTWDLSDDRTVYTFHLRPDAKWSNGDLVTARDFVYGWQRMLSPALAGEYAYMLYPLENARAFNEGEITDFGEVGAKAADDYTLVVTLEQPTPYFLSLQIHQSWYPVHQATIEKFGAMDERGTRWTRSGNLVSNGPFMLETWQPDEVITMVRNPHYWNAEGVALDGVCFHAIDNIQTEERAFRRGQLHVTESVPLHKIETYRREEPELLRNDPYLGTYYYRFNVTRPPFHDSRVRRALAMAIDRRTLVDLVLKGGQEPAHCFTPPDTAGYTAEAGIPYDVGQARALLAEAGFPGGEGFPDVELLYNTAESHKRLAEAIQQMWSEDLNISVSLVNQEWKVYLDSMNSLNYQMARSGWIGDFVDPVNFLECFTTGNGNNRTGYSNPEYDRLIAAAAVAETREERYAIFQRAEAILMEDAPFAPIYFYRRLYLKSPRVQGLVANPIGYIPFERLSLEGDTE